MPPPTTARSNPAGIRLHDGYKCVIAFERDPDVSLWEMEVTPPGIDGGDAINTTTMHNTTYTTKAPQSLVDVTDGATKYAYDPSVYTQLLALINQPGGITYHFPDGSTYDVYGYLKDFKKDPLVRGQMPTGTGTIIHTNTNPSTGAEEAPVLTSVAGT